jgi:hypothetical protein
LAEGGRLRNCVDFYAPLAKREISGIISKSGRFAANRRVSAEVKRRETRPAPTSNKPAMAVLIEGKNGPAARDGETLDETKKVEAKI